MKVLKKNDGQALVEFAIILPILLLILMGIVEFGMMLNSYLTVRNASREGARTAIVGSSDLEIKNLILTVSPTLNNTDLTVNITPSSGSRKSGDALMVEVKYNYHLTVPIISGIFANVIVLDAQTTMRIE
jgi:Flp pilus assembly protein TadG